MKIKNKIFTALMAAGIAATTFIPSFADVNRVQIDLDKPSKGTHMKAMINGKDTKLYVHILNGKAYMRERDFMAILGFKEQLPNYNDEIAPSYAIYNPTKDYVFEPRRLGTYDVGTKERPDIREKEPALWKYPRIKNYTLEPQKQSSIIKYGENFIKLVGEDGNRLDFLTDDTICSELHRKITDLPTAARGMVKYNHIPPVAVEVKYDNKTNKIIINTTMKLNKDMPAQKVGAQAPAKVATTASNISDTTSLAPKATDFAYKVNEEETEICNDRKYECIGKHMTKNDYLNDMLNAINEERIKNNAKPLVLDNDLNKVAEERVRMEQIIKTRDNVHLLNGERSRDTAKRILGRDAFTLENMFMTSYLDNTTANEMVRDWIASPGHHRNMINPSFTKIGIAVDNADIYGQGAKYGPDKVGAGVCYAVFE